MRRSKTRIGVVLSNERSATALYTTHIGMKAVYFSAFGSFDAVSSQSIYGDFDCLACLFCTEFLALS